MKWLEVYIIAWDVVCQNEIDDATAARALKHGVSPESISDHPFPGIPIMPPNLSEWSATLLDQRIAEARSE